MKANNVLTREITLPDLSFTLAWPWRRIVEYSTCVLVLCSVMLFCLAGWYARPMQDDHGYAIELFERGWIGYFSFWWHGWSGRYSAVFLEGLSSAPYGNQIVTILLPLVMLCSGAAVAITCGISRRRSLAIGAVLTAGTLLFTPDLGMTLFWRAAATGYVAPIALMGFYVALLIRHPASWLALLVNAALIAFLAGFSEIWSLLLVMGLFLTLTAYPVWFRGRPRLLRHLLIGFAFATIATAVFFSAPGNAVRAGVNPPPRELAWVLSESFRYTQRFFSPSWVVGLQPMLCLLFSVAAMTALLSRGGAYFVPGRKLLWLMVALPPILFGLTMLCVMPTVYATSLQPAPRTMVFPAYLCVALCVAYGAAAGPWLVRQRYGERAMIAGAALGLYFLSGIAIDVPRSFVLILQPLAETYDKREALIYRAKARGEKDLIVMPLADRRGLDITIDKTTWQNDFTARYYGLRSIKLWQKGDQLTRP